MNKLTVLLGTVIKKMTMGIGVEDAASGALGDYTASGDKDARNMWADMVKKLARIVDQFLPAAMIVLGIVAAIYVTILGVRYSKSENEDEKSDVKKKLINSIIGFVIGLVVMIFLLVFLRNVPTVASWINGNGEKQGETWYPNE